MQETHEEAGKSECETLQLAHDSIVKARKCIAAAQPEPTGIDGVASPFESPDVVAHSEKVSKAIELLDEKCSEWRALFEEIMGDDDEDLEFQDDAGTHLADLEHAVARRQQRLDDAVVGLKETCQAARIGIIPQVYGAIMPKVREQQDLFKRAQDIQREIDELNILGSKAIGGPVDRLGLAHERLNSAVEKLNGQINYFGGMK